jgi:hypothetical protein
VDTVCECVCVCVIKHSSGDVILNGLTDMWSGAESVVAGCAGHRAVHKKSLGPDHGIKFAKKNDVCLCLLTTILILVEVKVYKQNV